jgi:5-formyltetrahydrofolate cyclo-ligase
MEMTEEERAQAIFDLLHRHAPDVVYPTLQKCSPDQLEAVLAQVREMLDEARRTRGPDAWGVSP